MTGKPDPLELDVYGPPVGKREIVPGPYAGPFGTHKAKSLADLCLDAGDPDALVLYVNPNSRIPYRVQLVYLWIKHAFGFKL